MDTKKDEKLTIALKQVKNPDKICSLLLPELSSSRVVRSCCENLLDTGACPLSHLRGGNMSRTSNDVSPVGDHPVDTFVLYSMLRSLHFLFWGDIVTFTRSLTPPCPPALSQRPEVSSSYHSLQFMPTNMVCS